MLVMEYMHASLSSCLKKYPKMPMHIKQRILLDVTLGLRFLHERSEPILHRDLTANNILVTEHMQAKLSDLGMARIVPENLLKELTVAPGTTGYMPPEALISSPSYNMKLDIFSFGVLIMHVVLQEWPLPHKEANSPDPINPGRLIAHSEVERRADHFKMMDRNNPLTDLAKQCLSNNPSERPTAKDIAELIQPLVMQSSSLFQPFLESIEEKRDIEKRNDILEEHSKDIEYQLHRILQDMHSKYTLNECELDETVKQLQSIVRSTRSVLYGSCDSTQHSSYDSTQRRFVVSYKSPPSISDSKPSCYLHLSSTTSAPHPLSVVTCPSVNITFSGTYVKTVISGLKKSLGVDVSNDRLYVVDHEGWNGVHICSISGNVDTKSIIESSSLYRDMTSMPLEKCWYPSGIAVDKDQNIILVDTESHRLVKFSPEGTFLASCGKLMENGNGLGEFNRPVGVRVSMNGDIYVCDRSNHRIQVLSNNMVSKWVFGKEGKGRCEFKYPWDIAFDSKGNIYVVDCGNYCIKVFKNGFSEFVRQIGKEGFKEDEFLAPSSICIDTNDYIYVADKRLCSVKIFNPNGEFVMMFGSQKHEIEEFRLNKPMGIAVDSNGRVFVSDSYNGRVLMFE